MSQPFRRKRNRLDLEVYRWGYTYSFTFSTFCRRPLFRDRIVGARVVEYVRQAALKFDVVVLAYCVMPDHVHLLIRVPAGTSAIEFVKSVKQQSGFHLKQKLGVGIWQKSSYDHIVRREEDIASVAAYILQNPLRAGLVPNSIDYPLSGSFVWEREAILEA